MATKTCGLAALAFFCVAVCAVPAAATDATIRGSVYITDTANFVNVTSVSAGKTFVIDFVATDQAKNATIGNLLGFCVALRSNGPSQCQYTVQLTSGTIQASRAQAPRSLEGAAANISTCASTFTLYMRPN